VTEIDTAYNYDGFAAHRSLRDAAGDLLGAFAVTTKVGFFPEGHDLDPDRLRAAVKATIVDLGQVPDMVLIHNPERSPAGFNRACTALAGMKAEGLIPVWGISSWDPRLLLNQGYSGPVPDVLMLRAGLIVPSAVLEAGRRLVEAMTPVEVRGMAPFGHSTADVLWTNLDASPFLTGGQQASTIEAGFAVAFRLPHVAQVAVGTTNADHLAQLHQARLLDVNDGAVTRYRELLHRKATFGLINRPQNRSLT
jgi:pyridoxine 4-dehydrogenase